MDICISFDTTGSMYPVLTQVRRNVKNLCKALLDEKLGLNLSIVAHGDYCDEDSKYLMKSLDFTQSEDAIVQFVNETENTYGGDYPEAYEYVLNKVQNLSWTSDKRALVIIADAYPHEKNNNPYKLDWREQVKELAKMGINIYSVQALNSGNAKSYTFYKYMAEHSNGYHLYLNQFSHINDILLAIFYKQQDDDTLQNFEQQLGEREYGMSNSMRAIFDIMLGRESTYNHTDNFDYSHSATTSTVATTAATIEDLRPCPPSKYQLLHVDNNMSIKEFVQTHGLTFKTGKGFYEFTKSEIIQPKKQVVLMKKNTGDLYEGTKARNMIGLTNVKKRYKPTDIPDYRVFIQSTSYNRKLIGGTSFLYEADEWGC